MKARRWLCGMGALLGGVVSGVADGPWETMGIPDVGEFRMRVLTPNVVEVHLVTAAEEPSGDRGDWDFIDDKGVLTLPDARTMRLVAGKRVIGLRRMGFKRRVLHAPLGRWDARIGNALYLEMEEALVPGEVVRLDDGKGPVSLGGRLEFETVYDPKGWTPLVHVNQVGYALGGPKIAKAGAYLGTLGELDLADFTSFHVRDLGSGGIVFRGTAKVVGDTGLGATAQPYRRVLRLDFSAVDKEGVYTVGLDGLGESPPFSVGDGYWACLARTYALGILHQRCGSEVGEPFTRFAHPACHTAPARVPTMEPEFARAQELIRDITERDSEEQRAPELSNVATSLYPSVRSGEIDVCGGHHDAGDYSKYTINSALFINALVTAVDGFAGVSELDNLGLPESGDGISDLLQLAKWEGDFLAKMQDEDGGFFLLVYPRERAYEDDVTPDKGDAQIVFPKNTSATAAGSAALAQLGSSPHFRRAWPDVATALVARAEKGWGFLEAAWRAHGRDGAYQTISHYGDEFADRDEIAWAATELYLATGREKYHAALRAGFEPGAEATRRWNWVRQFEGYGAAVRSYAFAERSGRVTGDQLDRAFLRASVSEMLARADELKSFTDASAYGVAFPLPSKSQLRIGWFFAASEAFDLAAMAALGNAERYRPAIASNLDYELGANPVNVSFVTGLGWKRPFEIVHQWARNDSFLLPPSGIPLGSLQDGLPWIPPYEGALGKLSYPLDGEGPEPYGIYDRWSDTFNTATEFVNVQQARSLAVCAAQMARTRAARQAWRSTELVIKGVPDRTREGEPVELALGVADSGLDLDEAVVVWETRGHLPSIGRTLRMTPARSGIQWVSVEAQWPDGRRAFGNTRFTVSKRQGGTSRPAGANTLFLLSADADPGAMDPDAPFPGMPRAATVSITGSPRYTGENVAWMEAPKGAVLAVGGAGDALRIRTRETAAVRGFEISGWFQFDRFPHGVATTDVLTFGVKGASSLVSLRFDKWLEPAVPRLQFGHRVVADGAAIAPFLPTGEWLRIRIALRGRAWSLEIEGREVAKGELSDEELPREGDEWEIGVGGFEGFVDELRVDLLP